MDFSEIVKKEHRLHELNQQDPFGHQPDVIKEKLGILQVLYRYYRDVVSRNQTLVLDKQLIAKNKSLKVWIDDLRTDNHSLQEHIAELQEQIMHLNDQVNQMKRQAEEMSKRQIIQVVKPVPKSKSNDQISRDEYDSVVRDNRFLKEQLDSLKSGISARDRDLEKWQKRYDDLQDQFNQYKGISKVITRFPVRSVNEYQSFSKMWNDKINDSGWHMYLIGGYGVTSHRPMVKIGRAQNMKARFRLYDSLEPGYLKDVGQSTFGGRFDLRPGYQFPLGLYRLTNLGIDGHNELYFRIEDLYKAILRAAFSDYCLSGQSGQRLEFFISDNTSIYKEMQTVFDQISELLDQAGSDRVQKLLMQYSRSTLVKRLSVFQPVDVLKQWLEIV